MSRNENNSFGVKKTTGIFFVKLNNFYGFLGENCMVFNEIWVVLKFKTFDNGFSDKNFCLLRRMLLAH